VQLNNNKIAVIDIDNTLWDFATVLYERLCSRLGSIVPPPSEWHNWHFWKEFCDAETFYKTVKEIHLEQDRFGIYPDAGEFLQTLKSTGFQVIIASHRDVKALEPTFRWLQKHNLSFDSLHLSYDKTQLFSDCHLCVDDSPEVLKVANEKGLLATGLKFPWNKKINIRLFQNLSQITDFIKKINLENKEGNNKNAKYQSKSFNG